MLEILNGREYFFQWDTNQKLIIEDNEVVVVQYDNGTGDALVCPVYEYEGQRVADVPNIMLQMPIVIKAYAACEDCVRYARAYKVEQRSRPDDYIYTETETLKYTKLLSMLEEKEAALREDINTFTAEAAATDELLFEKLEAETQQLESEIESNAAAIETLNTSVDYIRNTELVNHNGRITYLQNTATNHDRRITKLEENGGTGGGNGCECRELVITLEYISGNVKPTFSIPELELLAMPIEELKKYNIKVIDYDNNYLSINKIVKSEDTIYFYIISTFISGGGESDNISLIDLTLRTDNDKAEGFYTIGNYVAINNLYRIPNPQNGGIKQYLAVENNKYTLVDDLSGDGGDSSSETQQNTILELTEENGVFTNETLPGITPGYLMENVGLEQLLTIIIAVGSMTNMAMEFYRMASVSMTDMSIIFSNGEKEILWAADGTFSYKE